MTKPVLALKTDCVMIVASITVGRQRAMLGETYDQPHVAESDNDWRKKNHGFR